MDTDTEHRLDDALRRVAPSDLTDPEQRELFERTWCDVSRDINTAVDCARRETEQALIKAHMSHARQSRRMVAAAVGVHPALRDDPSDMAAGLCENVNP